MKFRNKNDFYHTKANRNYSKLQNKTAIVCAHCGHENYRNEPESSGKITIRCERCKHLTTANIVAVTHYEYRTVPYEGEFE